MPVYKKSIETKQRIIDATIALTLEKGYANFGIKDITDRLEMPRSLVYYYYKNKDDIMQDIYISVYQRLTDTATRLTQNHNNPLVLIMVKYILNFRFIVQSEVLGDYFFSRPLYVSEGRRAIEKAMDTCYECSKEAFEYFHMDADIAQFYAFVVTSDSLMRALFEGLLNGTLTMSLRELIMYFGERAIMIPFNLSHDEFSEIVDKAFALTDTVANL